MTEQQQKALMAQIVLMYECWAQGINPDQASQLLNGLFDIAKEIDTKAMSDAFERGLRG